jgi:hypothetical protein
LEHPSHWTGTDMGPYLSLFVLSWRDVLLERKIERIRRREALNSPQSPDSRMFLHNYCTCIYSYLNVFLLTLKYLCGILIHMILSRN